MWAEQDRPFSPHRTRGSKDRVAGLVHPLPKPSFVAQDHEPVDLRCTSRELVNLYTGKGVENGEAGVDVPFVRVNP